ncbi:MAG: prepilin-type N-terminal cleavage/methylation domain-containing protein [Candidatus Omnitrophota bacterium]
MRNAQKGFTLVEVMLAAAISAIIIFGAFGILQASNRQLEVIHARMTLQEGPREALFKMAQEIRQTAWHKIDTLATPDVTGVERASTINFVVPVPAPDAASLVDSNFTPKWASNILYKLDTTTHQILRVSTDLVTNQKKQTVLANEITSLEFSRASSQPGLITITAGAQREFADGRKIPDEPILLDVQAEARNP